MFTTIYAEAEREIMKEIEAEKGFSMKKFFKIVGLSNMLSKKRA